MHELLPLLNETVAHWRHRRRDVFGKDAEPIDWTSHSARVVMSPGKLLGRASGENMPDAAATLWLLNHPRPVRIGDTFTLPDGSALNAVRVECRTRPSGDTLHKVFLS